MPKFLYESLGAMQANTRFHPLRLFSAAVLLTSILSLRSSYAQSGQIRLQPSQESAKKLSGPVTQASQPIVSAKIYWFAINNTGYGSAPISMILPTASGAQMDSSGNYYVLSTATGGFNISAYRSCPITNGSQYVLAVGGSAGNGQDNPNIMMVGVISVACGTGWYMKLSESATVAAAYGLGAFASFGTNSFGTDGNSSTALRAGVAYANSLYNTSTGATGAGMPWQATMNSLSSMMANCSATPSLCATLFSAATPQGGSAPANEFQASLNIAGNPSVNLQQPFITLASSAPMTPILSSYPTDWRMPPLAVQIAGISPQPAPIGSLITIGGTGFGSSQGTGTLAIGGVQAAITSWSDSAIVATIPNSAVSPGIAQVFQSSSASNSVPFNIGETATPFIASLSIYQGPPLSTFVINGSNFGSIQGASTITLGGTPLSVAQGGWTNNAITVQPPPGALSGNVVIAVAGKSSNGVPFTVASPPPCVANP